MHLFTFLLSLLPLPLLLPSPLSPPPSPLSPFPLFSLLSLVPSPHPLLLLLAACLPQAHVMEVLLCGAVSKEDGLVSRSEFHRIKLAGARLKNKGLH